MKQSGAKKMVLTHHDPTRSDDALDGILEKIHSEGSNMGIDPRNVTLAEFNVEQGAMLGSGDTGLSLRNYAKGILHLIERAVDEPSSETVERLHNYFLKTNPWCIRHGDGDFMLGGQVP